MKGPDCPISWRLIRKKRGKEGRLANQQKRSGGAKEGLAEKNDSETKKKSTTCHRERLCVYSLYGKEGERRGERKESGGKPKGKQQDLRKKRGRRKRRRTVYFEFGPYKFLQKKKGGGKKGKTNKRRSYASHWEEKGERPFNLSLLTQDYLRKSKNLIAF